MSRAKHLKIKIATFSFELEQLSTDTQDFILPEGEDPNEEAFDIIVTEYDNAAEKLSHEDVVGATLLEWNGRRAIVMSDEQLLAILRHRLNGHPA